MLSGHTGPGISETKEGALVRTALEWSGRKWSVEWKGGDEAEGLSCSLLGGIVSYLAMGVSVDCGIRGERGGEQVGVLATEGREEWSGGKRVVQALK